MTHYERAAKYVTKKLGKRFAKQHINSLAEEFREVAEEMRKDIYSGLVPTKVMTIDELKKVGEFCKEAK